MASENAKAVARGVIEKVRKGEKVVIGDIVEKQGYGKSMKTHPNKVTNTKSYQDEMKPVVEQLEKERLAVIKRLKTTRNKAKYRDLIDGLDKLTKNIQLLSGGATERVDWLTQLHDDAEKEQ